MSFAVTRLRYSIPAPQRHGFTLSECAIIFPFRQLLFDVSTISRSGIIDVCIDPRAQSPLKPSGVSNAVYGSRACRIWKSRERHIWKSRAVTRDWQLHLCVWGAIHARNRSTPSPPTPRHEATDRVGLSHSLLTLA